MAKRDYYEVLGVDKSASDQEIKKAFRRVAMKHPLHFANLLGQLANVCSENMKKSPFSLGCRTCEVY